MSTYHCSVKIVSRSTGRSSVGAAAYRAGEKIKNERDGITHDYTRKGGIAYSEIVLPENAPIQYSERAYLWNEVEKCEKRVDARTAREIEVALPRELNHQEQANMLRDYVKDNFVSRGMCADFSIHDKDKGNSNPHAHILLTTRNITPEGFTEKNREWNKKENVEQWRENWAQMYNREMAKKNLPDRVDHRSYERQGIDREPTIHRGPAAHHMEQRGIHTDRGNINRGIEARNRAYTIHISEIRGEADAYTAERIPSLSHGREDFTAHEIEIPAMPQGKTVISHTEPKEDKENKRTINKEQKRAVSRGENGREMPLKEQIKEREHTAPEREEGRTEPPRESKEREPGRASKMRMRGSIAALRGVSMPIGVMAVREMRKYQIDNIQKMARALRTIQQENIKSYGDFDRRINEYVGERQERTRAIKAIKKERDGFASNLGTLAIYEKHLKYRHTIENAGLLQKKKLIAKYELEIKALEGSEKRLERIGVDPKKESTAQWNTHIEELTTGIRILEEAEGHYFDKSQNVREAKKEMERLFIDKGIDYEMRYNQEIDRMHQEHGHGHER